MKKKFSILLFSLTIITVINAQLHCQNRSKNYAIIGNHDTVKEIIEKAANVTPSARQYNWQRLEFTAFVHFGINTFDKVEWGRKKIDISKFNPDKIDVNQWVKVFKDAGMKLVILTAKHHDGFCLWPTKSTDLNISHTPFQNGKGDIVRDLSNVCRKAGLKFGVYLSPWDMHEKSYGTPEYNKHFMEQLTELLTNYGEISEVWFDGANGEGPNGKKQVYDWHLYYKLIRKLQPNAVIAIMGPDVRWVGTESGYGRKTEWSVLPGSSLNYDSIAANSQQQTIDGAFTPHNLTDEDLGSRSKIEKAKSLIWYPAEIDVSIRPRWFYNNEDDDLVKSPEKLVDIYYNSVGLNGVLLLNVPPDQHGLINENDIKALHGMQYILNETFEKNLAQNGKAAASNERKGHKAKNILDDNLKSYWTTGDTSGTASIEIKLDGEKTFDRAMLQENILAGQRVEKFHLESWDGKSWNQFAEGTTIGYKRLLRFNPVTTRRVKIVIDKCRTNPTLASFGLYMSPPEIKFVPGNGAFEDSIQVKINSDSPTSKIYYTIDGSIPTEHSKKYNGDISLNKSAALTAIAVSGDGKKSLPVRARFNKARYGIKLNTSYNEKYPGSGIYNLVDGVNGSTNFNDGKWQGYNGSDIDAVIDLGRIRSINKISMSFLRDINSYIFLPQSVEYSVSSDDKEFRFLGEVKNSSSQNEEEAIKKNFELEPKSISARYIHVKAKNIGVCPPWHKGAGDKAWLFADEIVVE